MEAFLSHRIFLSYCCKKLLQLFRAWKRAPTRPFKACVLEELPLPPKEHSIRQIMNHFIQIHILFGRRSAQPGMLRVKGSGSTKVLPTAEHTKLHVGQLVIWKTLLGLQSWRRAEEEGRGGGFRGGGGFLRSNEL